jgi:hypothetical protein
VQSDPVMTRKQVQVAKTQAAAIRDFVTIDKIQVQAKLGCQPFEGLMPASAATSCGCRQGYPVVQSSSGVRHFTLRVCVCVCQW